jgi:integrase
LEKFQKELAAKAAEEETATAYLSVEEWVDDYLDFIVENNFAKKTYQEKKGAFERFAAFGVHSDMPVDEIDRYLCGDFFKAEMKEKVNSEGKTIKRTGNAVNKDRKNLGAAWTWGRENMRGWPVGENPFLAVPKRAETRHPRYVPSEEDFWKVYDYVVQKAEASGEDADIQDNVMLLSYLHLAARRSELFTARWSDVDFSRDIIRLWTRKRIGGAKEFDWLPMSKELSSMLKMWAEKRLAHSTWDKAHLFVCLSALPCCEEYYGKPFTKRRHALAIWCKKADVKPFGWHAIRHLTASTLYRRGYNQAHIQALLRHKSATTTARYLRSLGINEVRAVLDEGLQRSCEVVPFNQKTAPGGKP